MQDSRESCSLLNERQRRLYTRLEPLKFGRGGNRRLIDPFTEPPLSISLSLVPSLSSLSITPRSVNSLMLHLFCHWYKRSRPEEY